MNGECVKKADGIQRDLESRATAIQKKFQTYENRIKNGLVTRTEAMNMEQEMKKEQQDILQYRDEVLGKMAEEERVMIKKNKYNILDLDIRH